MSFSRFSLTILSAMLLFCSSMALADTGRIGLCYGRLSNTGVSKSGKGRISAAVIVPKSDLTLFDGAQVKAIRVGLVTADGVTNLTGWMRHDLTSENICEADFSNIAAGWNEAIMPNGFSIDANKDLVIGFSFNQQQSVKCLSVAGVDSDNGCWLAKDDDWKNRSSDFVGSWSVELVVEGDNVPSRNVQIISADLSKKVVKQGLPLNLSCVVRNTTLNDMSGNLTYNISQSGEAIKQVNHNVDLKYGDTDSIQIELPTDDFAVDNKYNLNIEAVMDGDEVKSDNTASLSFVLYDKSVERHVLLEEFTSEYCPNCPRAIETIATCMNEGYSEHLVQISHHVGYKDDWLTVDEDRAYEWFYGDNGTYAPAGMLDRTVRPEFSSTVPVFSIGYADSFRPMLDVAIEEPAFVEIVPTAEYNESSRQLNLSVDITKMPQLDVLSPNARLTVIITEDSILHHEQAGYSSSSFRHRHVYRKCLSDIWGDVIEWNGQTASMSYSVTLPEDWNDHYIEAVVFVSSYNPDDRSDCQVFNTGYTNIKSLVSSVHPIMDNAEDSRAEYFDLAGRSISPHNHGLYIKTVHHNDGTIVSTKLIH